MTDPQAAQLGAVVGGLIIIVFCTVMFVILLLAACHLWLDLQERLAERRLKQNAARKVRLMFDERDSLDWRRRFNHENTNRPSGLPPYKFRRREANDAE